MERIRMTKSLAMRCRRIRIYPLVEQKIYIWQYYYGKVYVPPIDGKDDRFSHFIVEVEANDPRKVEKIEDYFKTILSLAGSPQTESYEISLIENPY